MKTIEDILEALLTNSVTDWDENDPAVEFKGIYDALQRIHMDAPQGKGKEGYYYTDNLWCLDDVQKRWKCDDVDAMGILDQAMTNEGVMQSIWDAIDQFAEIGEFERRWV